MRDGLGTGRGNGGGGIGGGFGGGRRHRRRHGHGESFAAGVRTLAELGSGEEGVVFAVRGGDGMRRKAFELGMVPGAPVAALIGQGGGARVVRVGESRLIVGGDVAMHVLVSAGR